MKSDSGVVVASGVFCSAGVFARAGIALNDYSGGFADINVVGELAFLYIDESGFHINYDDIQGLNDIDLDSHKAFYCSLEPSGVVHYNTIIKPSGRWKSLFATGGTGFSSSHYLGLWQKVSD